MAEINVTPLVDVMLVLLIIFMVAAPLMTSGVPVDLPKTAASPINQESEPLTISVDPQGKIFLQDTEVQLDALVPQLQAIQREAARTNPDAPEKRIFVRGDRTNTYGRVMEVMGAVIAAGFTRVALLAEQPAGQPARPAAAPAAGARPAAPPARGPAAPAR
ncbi:protein TolR [Roseomonas sp. BN140053]|uniref:protein TolR n=1 Tax=Roseomonas sp. BN140053 TaxID=3391898 RepID=UPI0039E75EDF